MDCFYIAGERERVFVLPTKHLMMAVDVRSDHLQADRRLNDNLFTVKGRALCILVMLIERSLIWWNRSKIMKTKASSTVPHLE